VQEPVQHGAQNLSCHDEAAGGGVDGDVAGHQADIRENLAEVAELLVGKCLEGGGVDDALVVPKARRHGVLCDCSLARAGVGGNEYALAALDAANRLLLEGVELEGVPARGVRRCGYVPCCAARDCGGQGVLASSWSVTPAVSEAAALSEHWSRGCNNMAGGILELRFVRSGAGLQVCAGKARGQRNFVYAVFDLE
jgi:hypothetical protein